MYQACWFSLSDSKKCFPSIWSLHHKTKYMIDKDFEQLEKENIQWQKFNTSRTPSRNIFEFSNLFLGVLEVHQKPIEHVSGIIKHKYDLKDPYYAWLVNISGVVQYEDAPRTGTMKGFVLERITIVSANVQGGNKERM
jgi:hypothetical protein